MLTVWLNKRLTCRFNSTPGVRKVHQKESKNMKNECQHLIQTAKYRDEKLQNYSCNNCGRVIPVNPAYTKRLTKIDFCVRQVYGLNKMYITDLKIAEIVSRLTGERTLTKRAKEALEDLGFTFKQVI